MRLISLVAFGVAFDVAGATAFAQQVSTPVVVPTPAELAPKREAQSDPTLERREAPRAPREVGKPEDELTIDVAAYSVAPEAPTALRDALPRLTAAFVGKGRTYEDVVNAANEVTRYLQRELGYYLGYAYIPEQSPQDGVVRIAVLEGRLDKVVLNWSDDFPVDREVVQGYLDRLQPGAILTVQDVERAVFLVNDLRGITVRAEVKAGSAPGTAVLEFTPKADPRFGGKIDADINGSRFIGTERVGGLLTMNSPLGRGDGISLSALASISGGLQFALAGYTTPLGSDGLKAGFSLSALHYKLDESDFPLGMQGDGLTLNAFALYPWIRSRNLNLFVLGAADGKQYKDEVASIATKKEVNDLVIGVTGDFRDSLLSGGVNTFELNYSAGELRYPDGFPSGLDDARHYGKLNVSFSRLQNLVEGQLLAYLAMRGQVAKDNLDTTEQFRAGGPDGVRAFASGEGTGDSGLVASGELRWLPPESLFGQYARELVLAAFVDAAKVWYRVDPNLIPRDSNYVNHAGFAGAGLSLVWARPREYSLRLSVAKPIHGKPKSDTKEEDPRINLQGSWLF